MAKTIQGVPESLTRDQLAELIGTFGFEPAQITELRIDASGVRATVFETHADGTKVVNLDGSGFAKHTIHISVAD